MTGAVVILEFRHTVMLRHPGLDIPEQNRVAADLGLTVQLPQGQPECGASETFARHHETLWRITRDDGAPDILLYRYEFRSAIQPEKRLEGCEATLIEGNILTQ